MSENFVEMGWISLKLVEGLVTTVQRTTLLLELAHTDGWEGRGSVVLWCVVVLLVDWDGGVDYVWLNGLLMYNWLNCLVDVVMYMLAGNLWNGLGVRFVSTNSGVLVLELGLLLLEMLLCLCVITMVMGAVFDTDLLVMMLLWENFLVLYWLDRGMIMILVNFSVFYDLLFFASLLLDSLFLHCWGDFFVDSCVIVSSLAED